jgi:pimeloyl-ACP methyl ester carboxylesterase
MATVDQARGGGVGFDEDAVAADGFTIRCLTAGSGDPVVYLHGGGGLHLSPVHDALAGKFRVTAFEMPGFGNSPENLRTESLDEMAETMADAITAAGLDEFTLYGTSFGGAVALRIALSYPDRVRALVLESPAALRPADWTPASLSPSQLRDALYAHPEHAPTPEPPEVVHRQLALLARLSGPNQDSELMGRMRRMTLPVLVLFGTQDGLISPEIAPLYKELLINCYVIYVYAAAHEMQFDRPDAVAGVVADFVQRQEAFVVNATSGLLNPHPDNHETT